MVKHELLVLVTIVRTLVTMKQTADRSNVTCRVVVPHKLSKALHFLLTLVFIQQHPRPRTTSITSQKLPFKPTATIRQVSTFHIGEDPES